MVEQVGVLAQRNKKQACDPHVLVTWVKKVVG
jgi:hypothetical protein